MINFKWLLAPIIFTGGFIGLHAEVDNASSDNSKMIELGRYLAQADVDGVTQEGVGVSKQYLEKYFKTVELTFTTGGSLSSSMKPTFEV